MEAQDVADDFLKHDVALPCPPAEESQGAKHEWL
jgi:hypothetical protein